MQSNAIARDITYAHSGRNKVERAFIRTLENVTGRIGLIRRARGYEVDVANGGDFWQVMAQRFGLTLDVIGGDLANIPRTGPLILVANHPYGILDGLMMGLILSKVRGDFRILANAVFSKAEDLTRVVLPIDFSETREAIALNVQTRDTAIKYLGAGGAIGIFPGGTVSTSAQPFSRPLDPMWRGFTARMIAKSGATVVPVYFEGSTSRLFQLASHLTSALRMGLLIKEFKARVDTPVRIVVGDPIDPVEIAAHAKDSRDLMDFLRQKTYSLSPNPVADLGYGYEFEEKHRAAGKRART